MNEKNVRPVGRGTGSFKEALRNASPSVRKASLPLNASSWRDDGVDHLNISRYGATNLGRCLNLDHVRYWEHPVLGPFRSLNSLWFFLRSKHKVDAIRNLTGSELKTFVDKRCGGFGGPFVANFRAVILDSAYQRLKESPDILEELKKSELPFDCYRTLASGIRIRFDHSTWLVAGYEEIRQAVKENREPCFRYAMDRPGEDLYAGVLRVLIPEQSAKSEEEVKTKLQNPNTKVRRSKSKKQKEQVMQTEGGAHAPELKLVLNNVEVPASQEAPSVSADPVPEVQSEETAAE